MKTKMKTMYMHTISGMPGSFDGDQICYSCQSRPIKLAESLRQIRKEQKATAKFRGGFKWSLSTYGYRRIALPTN